MLPSDNKVYLLQSGRFSDIHVEGVFSTMEKAETALADLEKIKPGKAGPIITMILDELSSRKVKPYWMSSIDVLTGEIKVDDEYGYGIRYAWDGKSDWVIDATECVDVFPYWTGYISSTLEVYSSKSQEHADKLAVEARQRLMAKLDFSLITVNHGCLSYPAALSAILNGKRNLDDLPILEAGQ